MGEFQTLSENVTGGDGEAAFNLIASIPLAYGTNSSGFNAIPIGPATDNGCHNYEEAVFHSSEIVNYFSGYIEYVGMFEIRYNETSLCCGASAVETAAPIRCIKD